MNFCQTPRGSDSLTWRLSHQVVPEFSNPVDPFTLGVDPRAVPRWFQLLLIDRESRLFSRDRYFLDRIIREAVISSMSGHTTEDSLLHWTEIWGKSLTLEQLGNQSFVLRVHDTMCGNRLLDH